MRLILPESARRRKRAVGGTLASAIVHAVIIGGTIAATGWTAETQPPVIDDTLRLVYVKPRPPVQHRPPTVRPTVRPTRIPPLGDPPEHVLSLDITEGPPPIDALRIRTFALDSFHRTPHAANRSPSGAPSMGGESPMTSATVDLTVVLLPGSSPPRYPPMLANAGVEGTVIMQYVVDTLGRVEGSSVRLVGGGQPEFERAARDALARMRFIPAEAGGRRVRQLVEQAFTFALTSGKR